MGGTNQIKSNLIKKGKFKKKTKKKNSKMFVQARPPKNREN